MWGRTPSWPARSWLACAFLLGLLGVRPRGPAPPRCTRAVSGWRPKKAGPWRGAVRRGAVCGFGGAADGRRLTSTAKAGFLTALYVVIVPVLGLLAGRRPGARLWVCVAVSVAGLYLLCLAGRGYAYPDRRRMAAFAVRAAVCGADLACRAFRAAAGRRAAELCGVSGDGAAFHRGMLLFEQPTVEQLAGAAVAIAYCGILSSGVGYTLQIVGQQNLDPTIASMAMCLESVFSALAGWLLLRQTMSAPRAGGLRADVRRHRRRAAARTGESTARIRRRSPRARKGPCQMAGALRFV